MAHTRVSLRVHCIFGTKERCHAIPDDLQARAWAFIGGIARNLDMTAIAVGGAADHVHILLLLPPTIPLATATQKIKANSSRWLHEQTGRPFEWQEGYAAFSISISQTDATVRYIQRQCEHHQRRGYGEELAHPGAARHGVRLPSLRCAPGLACSPHRFPGLTSRARFWRARRRSRWVVARSGLGSYAGSCRRFCRPSAALRDSRASHIGSRDLRPGLESGAPAALGLGSGAPAALASH